MGVQMKNDLTDTEQAIIADQEFAANLEKGCATKEAEWAEIQKTRSEELVALAETIKVLNDDDALDLFKKTLPSASSFMQLQVSVAQQRRQALATIRASLRKGRPELNFLVLALEGRKV